MTREEAKTNFDLAKSGAFGANRRHEMLKVIDKIYDAHEANLKKACEILEGANLVEIERHFAECKAKDERIAKLEAKLDSIAQFLEGLNPYNQII